MLTVRPATVEDAHFLATRLRPADIAELEAGGGTTPLQALLQGVEWGTETLTGVTPEGTPFCMFGVGDTPDPLVGSIWLLGTEVVRRFPLGFNRHVMRLLPRFHQRYPVLMNCVHEANAVHIEWLRFHGFSFLRRIHHPATGDPFLEFARLRQCASP